MVYKNWSIVFSALFYACFVSAQPNVLVIVADDMGLDAMNGYDVGSNSLPITPNLDALRTQGLLFNNAWVSPACSPTRATILSAQYGNKTGVLSVPGNLSLSYETIFEKIADQSNNTYATAAFGKWHLGGSNDDHPNLQGVQHFAGVTAGVVPDYNAWNFNENGTVSATTEYATTKFTNDAIDWIDNQTQPWFVWMAHVAPHTPFHIPPDPATYSQTNTNGNRNKFIAMIEALDYEIGRLYNSLTETEKDNTLIIFIGDNGTSNLILRGFPSGHGKGSLYEGGIRVPMFATGFGVNRTNEVENGLVQGLDIYATILDVIGGDLSNGIFNSRSFKDVLSDANATTNPYNFTEYVSNSATGVAIRNEQYKLIDYADGTQEFFDLVNDPLETTELITNGLTSEQMNILAELETEADQRISAWSCQDLIKNGDEEEVDCGGSFCQDCTPLSISTLNYFEAIMLGQQVQLTWNLPAENEYQKLLVERSENAHHWTTIHTHEVNDYQEKKFIDTAPLQSNYYRLRLYDQQGVSTYSEVRRVIFDHLPNYTLEVYPNPTGDFFSLKNWNKKGHLYLYNGTGQLVKSQPLYPTIPTIPMNDLPEGMYFIKVIDKAQQVYQGRIIK